MKKIWLPLALFLAFALVGGYFIADFYQSAPQDVERNYVGREACITCHQEQASLFKDSHHDLAMDIASDETVLADFNQTLQHHGLTSKMYRDGDRFMIRTDGANGKMTDFEVKYVFGVFPLQQYMVEMPQTTPPESGAVGRLQVLRESWDVENNRWFYLNPPDVDERLQSDDPLHWTSVTQRWNTTCAACHSTNLEKNYDVASQSFHTTFSEIDVSCEACHGPGSVHVELANSGSQYWDQENGFGLSKLKTESNLPQVEMCATCHSRRRETQSSFVAGARFDDHFQCDLLMDRVYHADGQIRDEDYVYGSFKQSKMFHKGIRCTDCHDPHSTKIKFQGNDLCTSCHQHPAGQYDSPNHHHHKVGSTGSLCVECHMPETTYMAIDPRRDHSLRVPRPDMSVKYSTPNACTGCHLESENLTEDNRGQVTQYLDWILEAENGNQEIAAELKRIDQRMSDAVVQWYGESSESRSDSYYEKFAKVRTSENLEVAVDLMKDREVPSIVRASTAFVMAGDPSTETLEVALENLKSKFPDLVFASLLRVQSELARLSQIPNLSFEDKTQERMLIESVANLLDSERRLIRIEAVRVLAQVRKKARDNYLSGQAVKNFDQAFAELEESTMMQSDSASSHLSIAGLYELLGEIDSAERAYRNAIKVAPNESRARSNLAALLQARINRVVAEVEDAQRRQVATPSQLESAGKRIGKYQEEITKLRVDEHRVLGREVEIAGDLGGTDLLHYRYAMSSYLQKQYDLTEKHLQIAHEQRPEAEDYIIGLATYYQFVKNFDEAIRFTQLAIEINPNDIGYKNLLEDLQKEKRQKDTESNDN